MNQATEKTTVSEKRKRKASEMQPVTAASGGGDHSDSNMKNMETIMSHLGYLYQKANMRIKLVLFGNAYGMGTEAFMQDCQFVSTVDNLILSCGSENQRIIRKQFFDDSDEDWYEDFYSKESFRRHLITAMCEFIRRCRNEKLPPAM